MVAPQCGASTGSVGGTKKGKKKSLAVRFTSEDGGWVGGWRRGGGGKEVTVDFKENILCVKVAHRFITLSCDMKGVLCCHTLKT